MERWNTLLLLLLGCEAGRSEEDLSNTLRGALLPLLGVVVGVPLRSNTLLGAAPLVLRLPVFTLPEPVLNTLEEADPLGPHELDGRGLE